MSKIDLAFELNPAAEELVRAAEDALDGATDPTLRDCAETDLRSALALQDQVLESVGPTIAERERQVMADIHVQIVCAGPGGFHR